MNAFLERNRNRQGRQRHGKRAGAGAVERAQWQAHERGREGELTGNGAQGTEAFIFGI